MQVAPGVHHFTGYKFNWYIVEEGDRLTVIDAGFPSHFRLFERGLESLGRAISDVEAIIITHAHADHTGFAARLSAASGAPIHVHEGDVPLVRRPLYLPWTGLLSRAWRPYTASMLSHAIGNGLLRLTTIPAPRPMRDADELDAPGRPRILHVPGHTPGDVAVHLPARGVLFSGDAMVTRNLYTGRDGGPQLTSRTLNGDFEQARRSLDRLADLGPVVLLPGHGRPWVGDTRDAVAANLPAARR
ncbi:MAG: MBL fold metallo-hydrolase [Actinobacteria bacterium]|nr:MBL fold metallo-hydrolase [Actinomycetota bacterium]